MRVFCVTDFPVHNKHNDWVHRLCSGFTSPQLSKRHNAYLGRSLTSRDLKLRYQSHIATARCSPSQEAYDCITETHE